MTELRDELFKAREDTLKEIVRQGESFLATQVQLAVAADTRAMTFAGIMATAASLVGGGTFGLLVANKVDHYAVAGAGLTVGFLLSMAFAHMAAMPVDIGIAGRGPEKWAKSINGGDLTMQIALADTAQACSESILSNAVIFKRNGCWMKASFWIAWASLILALLTGLFWPWVQGLFAS
jgi:hypothetical protein